MNLIKVFFVGLVTLYIPQASHASTFNPSTVGFMSLNGPQTCTNSTSGTFNNVTCNSPEGSMSTSASATGGVLKTGNQTAIDYSAVPGPVFGVFSHAGAGYTDTITVANGASSGFLDISLRVQGTGTIGFTGTANSGSAPSLFLEVLMNNATYSAPGAVNFVTQYLTNMSIDQIFTASIPYQNFTADFSVYLNTFVSCPGVVAGSGGTCTSSMDFLNSATVLGTQVFDTSRNLISGASLASASGFNYSSGVTSPVSPVPLPASIPLFAAALALLGVVTRKRRHQIGG